MQGLSVALLSVSLGQAQRYVISTYAGGALVAHAGFGVEPLRRKPWWHQRKPWWHQRRCRGQHPVDGLPAIGANGKAAGARGVEPIIVTLSQA
jgi:hypothetical protein